MWSEDAEAFAKSGIIALWSGGEVDFDDSIIINSTFKNNQKAKCVYDRMKILNGSLFSDLLSRFDNHRNAKLTFKVDNIPQPNPNVYNYAKTLPRYNGGTLRTFDIVLDTEFVENASLIEIAFALLHEMIHAEIMERCIQLGIVTAFNYNSNWEASLNFSNSVTVSTDFSSLLFATLVANYSNYLGAGPSSTTNWQHDLYNVLNYRTKIAESLAEIHNLLDDTNNSFENNLNNGTVLPMTMTEYFNLISWLGLEETEEYNNLSALEITKINQAINQTQLFYNENCN